MKEWKYSNPSFECDEINHDLLAFAPWSGHRCFAYDFIGAFEPKTVVELGSHYGCSAFTFAQAAKDFELDTDMYFVDTWEGDDFTKKYGNDVYTIFSKTVEKYYPEQNINMLRMTFNEAVDKFDDNSIDLLHIDGSHHYDDVKGDFENWFRKVKKDGIIMLHDVSSDIVLGDIMGSHKYWLELKAKFKHTVEFDFSWGLGIIFLSKEKYKWFKANVNINKYQRVNNALDVDFKDVLRKNHFELKDKQIYIDDLLEQKRVLTSHLESYKDDMKAKDKYLDELKGHNDNLLKEIERVAGENKEILSQNEKNAENWKNERRQIIADYENQAEDIKKAFNSTIEGKDKYIDELLEQIKNLTNCNNQLTEQKNAFEQAYYSTINYKLGKIKRKFIK